MPARTAEGLRTLGCSLARSRLGIRLGGIRVPCGAQYVRVVESFWTKVVPKPNSFLHPLIVSLPKAAFHWRKATICVPLQDKGSCC